MTESKRRGSSSRSEWIEIADGRNSILKVIREEWNFAINVNRQRYAHTHIYIYIYRIHPHPDFPWILRFRFPRGEERRGYKTRETEGIKGCRKEMGERREKRAVKWWKGRVETEIASGGAVSLCKPDPLFGLGYIDFERVDTVCIKFWIIGRRCRVEDSNAPLTKLSLYTVPPAKLHLKFRAFVWSLLEFSDISPNNSVNCFIYIRWNRA